MSASRAPSPTAGPQVLLGHGASATAESMRPWVTELAKHGIGATALNLPKSSSERAIDVFRSALVDHRGAAIGGHSYGGRMASLLAAQQPVKALVLLSYPLHRPGHPDQLRTEHWPRIECPVLLLSGDRDPFATVDLLRREVQSLPDAELVIFPGQRHGLLPVRVEAAARIAAFLVSRG
jgi:predicted alpha/beta-hydrolase family hydrolase